MMHQATMMCNRAVKSLPASPTMSRIAVLYHKLEYCFCLTVVFRDQPVHQTMDVVIDILCSELEHLLLKLFSKRYENKIGRGCAQL